jgi:MFS family permease
MVATAVLCLLAPGILFEPIGGVIADRYDRRRIMALSGIATAVLNVAIAFMAFAGMLRIDVLLMVLLAYGAINAVSHASGKTIVTAFVPKHELASAVSLNAVTFHTAQFIGPALAGIVIAALGAPSSYVIGALLTFCFVAGLQRVPPMPPTSAGARQGVAAALHASLYHVLGDPMLRLLFVLHVAFATLSRPFVEFIPAVIEQVFAGGAGNVAMVTSAVGIGSLMGGLWLAGRDNSRGLLPVALGAMPALGLAMVLFIWSPSLWFAVLMALAAGVGMNARGSSIQSMLQLEAGADFRGRVVALYSVLMDVGAISGALFIGLLGELIGLRGAISTSVLLALLVWWIIRTPLREVAARRAVSPES